MTKKLLFVGTVNGESSLTNKKAKTYIYAKDVTDAVIGLFKRYMKMFGKATVTELFLVDKETKKVSKLSFNFQNCLRRIK